MTRHSGRADSLGFRSTDAWLSITHQHWNSHSSGRRHRTRMLIVRSLFAMRSLRLVPMVLEPDLHLRRCQPDKTSQVLPFGCGQILLLTEAPFQLECLRFGKEHATFAFLVRTTVRVSTVHVILIHTIQIVVIVQQNVVTFEAVVGMLGGHRSMMMVLRRRTVIIGVGRFVVAVMVVATGGICEGGRIGTGTGSDRCV